MSWRAPLLLSLAVMMSTAVQAQTPAATSTTSGNWQKQWADVQKQAEGQTLALVVHPVAANVDVANAFQKRFPKIKLRLTQIPENRFAPRLLKEQQGGIFAWDGFMGPTANMNDLVIPASGLEALDAYLILPEVKDPANWRSPQYRYASKGHYNINYTFALGATAFGNRSRLGNLQFHSPEDLLNPKLKGQIGMRDPGISNGGTISFGGMLKSLGPKGPAFLKRFFKEMNANVIDNPFQISSAVMRGDKAIVIGAQADLIAKCWSAGGCKNVEKLDLKSGVYLPRSVSIPKNPPNKAAATVWINWVLSKEGQSVYVPAAAKMDPTAGVSERKDVPPAPNLVGGVPDLSNPDKFLLSSMQLPDDAFQKNVMVIYKAYKAGR